MFESIFDKLCCVSTKDENTSGRPSSLFKPIDHIRSKPSLVRVLYWIEKVEDNFKDSMTRIVQVSLEDIIYTL